MGGLVAGHALHSCDSRIPPAAARTRLGRSRQEHRVDGWALTSSMGSGPPAAPAEAAKDLCCPVVDAGSHFLLDSYTRTEESPGSGGQETGQCETPPRGGGECGLQSQSARCRTSRTCENTRKECERAA